MKYTVKTSYYNPVLGVWEDENTTPYLKPGFTNWRDYAIMNKPVQVKKG